MQSEVETRADQKKKPKEDQLSKFSCKICLEIADKPVITPCGHLYCWPCIYKWAQIKPCCPSCNNKIDINKLITIYAEEDTSTQSEKTTKDTQQSNYANQSHDSQQPQQSNENINPNPNSSNQQQQHEQQQQQNEDIPHRPQNPRDTYEPNRQQGQNNNNGGFNFQFFGFPGFLLGGFGGLGGFGLNLGGFQFGGNQGNNNNVQGWRRYLMWLPVGLFLFQFFYPILSQIFGWTNSTSNYSSNSSYSQNTQSNRRSSSRNSGSAYDSRSGSYKKSSRKSYASQNTYDYMDESSDFEFNEMYGDIIQIVFIFVLMGLVYFLNKRRNNNR